MRFNRRHLIIAVIIVIIILIFMVVFIAPSQTPGATSTPTMTASVTVAPSETATPVSVDNQSLPDESPTAEVVITSPSATASPTVAPTATATLPPTSISTLEPLVPAVTLAPFTMRAANISGVAPVGWDEIQPGTYIRDDAAVMNTTYLLHIATPGTTPAEAIQPLLPALRLDKLPEPTRHYAGQMFSWLLYDVTYHPTELNGEALQVQLAAADLETDAYIIVFQSRPEEFNTLYEMVMIPALDTFGSPLSVINDYLNRPPFSTVAIEDFHVEALVPNDWINVNPGAYMRGLVEDDFTTLLIQTSPNLGEPGFARLLLNTLGLDTTLPAASDVLEMENFNWTLYRLTFETQSIPTTLQIATASDDTQTYMVALLAAKSQSLTLYDEIFAPIIASVRPLAE